ncbi:MAG: 2-dehydropantoate 2-reductase [Rhodospirillales bacterium]
MKITIYGAGAIGGLLGFHLAEAGADVTLIARGPHLAAMRADGLTLIDESGERSVAVRAVEDPAEAGVQDYVLITLKATGVAAIAEPMQPLLGPETCVVTAQNGIPWWYFYALEGPYRDRRVESVDPGGRLWNLIPPKRCLGCVVYPAAEIERPGVIRHVYGNRFMLGEPDGTKSARALALSKALAAAGMKAPVRTRIRDDLWLKLWGNLSFNPLSALTGATLEQLAGDPEVHGVAAAMMTEAKAVGEALGVRFSVDVETRIGWAADVGAHKTSMLQDLEIGRPMEIDALVTAVAELGDVAEIETPAIDTILALVRQRARLAGCYPE